MDTDQFTQSDLEDGCSEKLNLGNNTFLAVGCEFKQQRHPAPSKALNKIRTELQNIVDNKHFKPKSKYRRSTELWRLESNDTPASVYAERYIQIGCHSESQKL